MSCPSELVCTAYVDGGLPGEEVRPLETHLVGCRSCRERIVLLREETALLRAVLGERERAPAAARLPAPAARGVAVGLAPAVAAAAAVLIGFGWLSEQVAPEAGRWLGPVLQRGPTDMAFDLLFLLRDQAPVAFDTVKTLAALASASALLTFALTALLRRTSRPTLLALAGLAVFGASPRPADAHFGLHRHEDFTLAAGETHDGTLVVSAHDAAIDGVIDGDLIVLARRLTIRGEVRGNVIAGARSVELSGRVDGSVHVATGRAGISGEITHNLYAAAEELRLEPRGRVDGDAALFTETAVLDGSVGRDLLHAGERLELRGSVERRVRTHAERVVLVGAARIGGDLEARLPPGEEIAVSPEAKIGGEVTVSPHHHHPERRGLARYLEPGFWLWLAVHVAAAFAVGMLLHALLPAVFDVQVPTAGAFFRSLGIGFLVAVAGPIALGLLALSLVGLPVALMGSALLAASAYVGLVVVAALIGAAVVRPDGAGAWSFGLTLLAGLVILTLLGSAPILGPLVTAAALLAGLGLLAERARRAFRARRALA